MFAWLLVVAFSDSTCRVLPPADEREVRRIVRADSATWRPVRDESVCRRLNRAVGVSERLPVYAFDAGKYYVVLPNAGPIADEIFLVDRKFRVRKATKP